MSKQKSGQKKRPDAGHRKADASWMDTDRVVNKAHRIVSSAVNVLEEEIAAGILAARRIEDKLIDVDEIRSDPDALMNRIRRDSHEVLDLVIDAFASLTSQMNSVLEAIKAENAERNSTTKKPKSAANPTEGTITLLEPDSALRPGESVTLTISLLEDAPDTKKVIQLRKVDLIGPGSQVINKRAIQITPKTLTLKSGVEGEIAITLNMPKNSAPGRYNALLTDQTDPAVRIVVAVEIIESEKS